MPSTPRSKPPLSPGLEDRQPPVIPPLIPPELFAKFPALRETFLVYITDPTANSTLRGLGELLHTLILEYWRYWPEQPEGFLRANLRAVVADMRHLQGFLQDWAGPEVNYNSRHEEHLGKVGGKIARKLGKQADRLERELGSWRGEVAP